MKHKIFFSLILSWVLLFSANLAFAQTCSDPTNPVGETGRCLSKCDTATEHEISGTCLGQVCCASNPSGSSPAETCRNQGDACGGSYGSCCSPFGCYPESGGGVSTCQMSGYTGDTTPAGSSDLPTVSTGATSSGGWSLGNISGFGLPGGSIMAIAVNILIWILGI